ncbi:hypothetical protein HHK36_006689 [Tetracentron sinense]|uniref:Uncharacterized protein n=1 Tax=Tetracentron sinense TaxID=13715 RepID=A0A834ZHL3_TETSI|nr:hypothetical protein HHK36_006689 [Tetracentron sinense]
MEVGSSTSSSLPKFCQEQQRATTPPPSSGCSGCPNRTMVAWFLFLYGSYRRGYGNWINQRTLPKEEGLGKGEKSRETTVEDAAHRLSTYFEEMDKEGTPQIPKRRTRSSSSTTPSNNAVKCQNTSDPHPFEILELLRLLGPPNFSLLPLFIYWENQCLFFKFSGHLRKSSSEKLAERGNGMMIYLIFDNVELIPEWDKSSDLHEKPGKSQALFLFSRCHPETILDLGVVPNEDMKRRLFSHLQPHIAPSLNKILMVESQPSLEAEANKEFMQKCNMRKVEGGEASDDMDFHMSTSAKYLLILHSLLQETQLLLMHHFLIQLGVLIIESAGGRGSCPLEGSTWYRSTVGEEMALKVARSVKFPLSKLIEFAPLLVVRLNLDFLIRSKDGMVTVAEACLSMEYEDSLSPGFPPISTGLPSGGDEIPPGATLTAHILYHLAAKERTTSSAHIKGSTNENKHGPVSLKRASLDVQIPLGKILSKEEPATDDLQLPESIEAFLCGWNSSNSPPQNGALYLEAILDRSTKDGALLIKKWFQETLCREKMAINVRTHPDFSTSSGLHSMVKALAENQSSLLRNRGVIQLAVAADLALSEPHFSQWDAFISAERILRVSAGEMTQRLSAQHGNLINWSILVGSREQKNQNMDSSQGLLAFQDEHFLKEAIVDAIHENPAAAKLKFLRGKEEPLNQSIIEDFDDDQWGSWGDEYTESNSEQVYGDMQLKLELRDRVDNLFKFFHKLSSLKMRNVTWREGPLGLESNYADNYYTNKGLLYKLLTKVMGKYDIPALEYHSSTVGRLFKSGSGRFGLGQAKPSLGDQIVILVSVVGSINCCEVREAQEAFTESGRPDIELIIGGHGHYGLVLKENRDCVAVVKMEEEKSGLKGI